jgi:polyvinyl alcohol dehydrogenase (cytochrome)
VSRLLILASFPLLLLNAQEPTRVFMQRCQQCHSPNSGAHAPLPEAMAGIPWEDILKSLETGGMKAQGAALSVDERKAVARYLGKAGPVVLPEMGGHCAAGAKPVAGSSWNGWGVDDWNSRFQPTAAAGMSADTVGKLQLKWAFGFPNGTTAFGQPTIVDGRIFTGSNDGTVYALDAHSGCIYWMFQAKTLVRSAVVAGPGPRAYVGDLESNFYALNAETGELIWQKKLDSQPFTRITGTPKLHDGRLYVPIASQEENSGSNPQYPCCTFRGNVVALEAATGKEIWRTFTTPEPKPTKVGASGVQYYGPSGATIWSSPTLDLKRKLLYVATGNGYSDPPVKTADAVVAMDLETGAIRWTQQATLDMFNWGCGRGGPTGNCPADAGDDVDFGSSPILLDLPGGKQILVAGQKSGVVHGFDPDQNGKIVWQTRIGKGGKLGGVLWGMAANGGVVFAPLSDLGLPTAGGLFALDAGTGKIVWQAAPPKPGCAGQRGCSTAQLAPPTAVPGAVFSGSMDGHLRAYRTTNGEILWDFDTAHEFQTMNKIPARGGSFSGTGPTVADGMLYVNSGYANTGGLPGNVLLAFEIGK